MKYRYIILLNVVVSVLYLASSGILQMVLFSSQSDSILSEIIYAFVIILMGIIILYLLMQHLYKRCNKSPRYHLQPLKNIKLLSMYHNKVDIQKLLIGIALSVFLVLFVAISKYLSTGNIIINGSSIPILKGILNSPFSFIFLMLIPAISEEIIFRACLLHLFVLKNKNKLGLIVTGAIFGGGHILNLISSKEGFTTETIIWLLNVSFAGVLLGYMYIRFGIIIAMFLHWFWNASWYRVMIIMEKSIFFLIGTLLLIIIGEILLKALYEKRKYIKLTISTEV